MNSENRFTKEDIVEFVEKGVELLDKAKPDWYKEIDMEAFYISSCQQCILGQLFGNYTDGTIMLGVSGHAYEHGFDIPSTLSIDDGVYFEYLQREWEGQIEQRRNSAKR